MQNDLNFLNTLQAILGCIFVMCMVMVPFAVYKAIQAAKEHREALEELEKSEQQYWKRKLYSGRE